MVVLPVWFLLGSLFFCGLVEAQSTTTEMLKQAAIHWNGTLTCDQWDCNCTFNRQRGCCCAANEMFQIDEDTFTRVHYLWQNVSELNSRVQELTDCTKIAFKASMDPDITTHIPGSTERCFGPFNTDVPMPYATVTLNDGKGYNPSLGVFTAPCDGLYVFSYSTYSYVKEGGRLYHKVQLMKNGHVVASVWENNREDGEDSATQVVVQEMRRGDQVYMALMSGRKLCEHVQHNVFTGYMLYPYSDE